MWREREKSAKFWVVVRRRRVLGRAVGRRAVQTNNNHNNHNNQTSIPSVPISFVFALVTMDPTGQPLSAAQRRKQRRLRSWWRHEQQSIAAALATSSLRGQKKARAREEDYELHGQGPEDSSSQAGALQPVRRRARRRAACQTDTVVPEQVIEVPKITSTDVIPQLAVLRVPQMAEQLVDEPTPSFDDFELVQEVEEEEEQPCVVPESYFWDAAGHEWCRVSGPAMVYWWVGTSSVQYTSPEGYTARPGLYSNTAIVVPVMLRLQVQ